MIVPLFALANAGVDFGGGVLGDALQSTLTRGPSSSAWWSASSGRRPARRCSRCTGAGARCRRALRGGELAGLGALAGIGFTVSLFIAELAFDDERLVNEAKVGIIAGSLISGVLGAVLLARRVER